MKKTIGVTLLSLAGLIEAWLLLVLILQGLAATGLIDQRGRPSLAATVAASLILQVPLLALMKAGLGFLGSGKRHDQRHSISLSAKLNLLFVAMIIPVVVFLKTAIPYLQHQGNGYGIAALACILVFVALCFSLFRVWNKFRT